MYNVLTHTLVGWVSLLLFLAVHSYIASITIRYEISSLLGRNSVP